MGLFKNRTFTGEKKTEGKKLHMKKDMIIYRGCNLEHWQGIWGLNQTSFYITTDNEKQGEYNILNDGRPSF